MIIGSKSLLALMMKRLREYLWNPKMLKIIKEAIIRIYTNKELREELGKNGHNFVKKFMIEKN